MALNFSAEDVAELEHACSRILTGGRTWWVATTGNDSNGGTYAAPKLTVEAAASAAADGDTIFVRPGTYSENGMTISGKTLHFRGMNALLTIITSADAGQTFLINQPNWSFEGLTINNTGDGKCINDGSNIKLGRIENCYLNCVNNMALDLGTTSGTILRNIVSTSTNAQRGFSFIGSGWVMENVFHTMTISDAAIEDAVGFNVGGTGTIRNCQLTVTRSVASDGDNRTVGVQQFGGSNIRIDGLLIAISTHASELGDAVGLRQAFATSEAHLRNVRIELPSSGSNNKYAFDNAIAGAYFDEGGNSYSLAQVSGTLPVMNKADNRDGEALPTADESAAIKRIVQSRKG